MFLNVGALSFWKMYIGFLYLFLEMKYLFSYKCYLSRFGGKKNVMYQDVHLFTNTFFSMFYSCEREIFFYFG